MYVISQEGDITINVKSTVGFKAEHCKFNGKWEIRTIFPDCEYLLGMYDTEERAKEVLQELMNYYSNIEKNLAYSTGNSNYIPYTLQTPYYFNMPKE